MCILTLWCFYSLYCIPLLQQCDIPEEYKVGPKPEVDVMAFLGIKRLEPLQVLRDWD